MPLITIDGAQAYRNLRSNRFRTWPVRSGQQPNRVDPICEPALAPSFRIDRSDRIFAIGSCFARNIEMALEARGFDVATAKLPNVDPAFTRINTAVQNNYGLPSILNELQWALCPEQPFIPEDHIFEMGSGLFQDIHLNMGPDTRDVAMSRRAALREVTQRIVDCRIVVITLGLSEVWYDTLTKRYINFAVPKSLIAKFPDRFQVRLLDFSETMATLQEIIALLTSKCRNDQRIVLTVSPVPLTATLLPRDVIVSNAYSKSVLRTAVEHLVVIHPHIDYFSSYESIVLSDRMLAWQDDNIHVTKQLIDFNVERMIAAYTSDREIISSELIESTIAEAKEAMEAYDDFAAIRILEPLRAQINRDLELARIYATLCLNLKRFDDALTAIQCLPEDERGWLEKLLEALKILRSGSTQTAIDALATLADDEPNNSLVLSYLLEVFEKEKRYDEAIAVAFRWSRLSAQGIEPFRRIARIHEARKDFQSAEQAYMAAIAKHPASNQVFFDYVEFLISRGRLQDAAIIMERVAPENSRQIDTAETLKAFLPALPSPSQSDRTQVGVLVSDAKIIFARGIAKANEQQRELLRSTRQLLMERRYEEVILATDALLDGSLRLQALRVRGRALTACNRHSEAENAFRAVLEADSDNAGTYCELASVLEEQGRIAEANEYVSKAIECDPTRVAFRAKAIRLLMKAGKLDEAAVYIEEGLSLAPGNPVLEALKQHLSR